MEERGMNERIRKLRKLSLETPAHIDMELSCLLYTSRCV